MFRDHGAVKTVVRVLEQYFPHENTRAKQLCVNLACSIVAPMDSGKIIIILTY